MTALAEKFRAVMGSDARTFQANCEQFLFCADRQCMDCQALNDLKLSNMTAERDTALARVNDLEERLTDALPGD